MRDARGDVKRPIGLRLWLSGGWLTLLVLAAVFAPIIAPKDPLMQDLFLGRMPPFWNDGTESGYWLGTDSLGRDVQVEPIFARRRWGRGQLETPGRVGRRIG